MSGALSYAFSYDAYGNITGNGLDSYDYDDASHMTAVTSLPGRLYRYDGNGMRAASESTAGTTYFAYGRSGRLLVSKDDASDITAEHYYLGSQLVAKRQFGAGVDDDLDNDGMTDDVELQLGLNPANASDANADLDGDGATNIAEYLVGALLSDSDSDNDGMVDGYELRHGLDAVVDDSGYDSDGDNLTNLQEFELNTNPNDTDTDNDGVPDNVDSAPMFNPALLPAIDLILRG